MDSQLFQNKSNPCQELNLINQEWIMLPNLNFLVEEKLHTNDPTHLGVVHSLGLSSPYRRLPMRDFLVDMQPSVHLKDNMHISNSKKRKLNYGYLINLQH